MFGGYNRYFSAAAVWRKFGLLPAFGRQLSARLIRLIPAAAWNMVAAAAGPALPASSRERQVPSGRVVELQASSFVVAASLAAR